MASLDAGPELACSGMARGELRSTLSRASPLQLPALTHQSPEIGKEKTNFPFHSAFTIFAENGVFSKDEEMSAK